MALVVDMHQGRFERSFGNVLNAVSTRKLGDHDAGAGSRAASSATIAIYRRRSSGSSAPILMAASLAVMEIVGSSDKGIRDAPLSKSATTSGPPGDA
ncbi:MAG: hypothetical protein J0H84_18095 [Rhizobiales bacterium]|nr:hypothetical protein [Hyphomicrobiales bacterium]